jgi:hypothetical protein
MRSTAIILLLLPEQSHTFRIAITVAKSDIHIYTDSVKSKINLIKRKFLCFMDAMKTDGGHKCLFLHNTLEIS